MVQVVESTLRPLMLSTKILDVAYQLYLAASQESHLAIDLHVLSCKTDKSLLDCRNAIVEANRLGWFPNCSLKS